MNSVPTESKPKFVLTKHRIGSDESVRQPIAKTWLGLTGLGENVKNFWRSVVTNGNVKTRAATLVNEQEHAPGDSNRVNR